MIEPLTLLDQHRANIREATLNCLVEADHLASAMTKGFQIFWSKEPSLMLELLNSNVAFWLGVLQDNTEMGTIVNAKLDKANLPQFHNRVPLAMPEGYAFENGQFTFTPPAPEPEPS
jgi:hypothetical protein